MLHRRLNTHERLYVQLVCSVYDTLIPATIMSMGFVVSFALMAAQAKDPALGWLAAAGAVSGAWRLAVLMLGRREAVPDRLAIGRARVLERRFSIAYYQFAGLMGVSAAYAFMAALPHAQMLIVCLLVGYGAGAAVGIGLRPWIAVPSMIVAIAPSIVVVGAQPDPVSWLTAALMFALLIGGILSLLGRYRIATMQIAERFTFETLARRDDLTALPNRLALREWYDVNVSLKAGGQVVAIHCLDLDKFKPVNDAFGHPTGDGLLQVVAERLTRTLRPGDIAARLGGDEFAIVQRELANSDEAIALAHRLRDALAEPFSIQGHVIEVSACVGICVSERAAPDLEDMLNVADQALYRAKKSGTGLECIPIGQNLKLAS